MLYSIVKQIEKCKKNGKVLLSYYWQMCVVLGGKFS